LDIGRWRALPDGLAQPAQRLFECLGPPLQRGDLRAMRAGGFLSACVSVRISLRATRAISLLRAEAIFVMGAIVPRPAKMV